MVPSPFWVSSSDYMYLCWVLSFLLLQSLIYSIIRRARWYNQERRPSFFNNKKLYKEFLNLNLLINNGFIIDINSAKFYLFVIVTKKKRKILQKPLLIAS